MAATDKLTLKAVPESVLKGGNSKLTATLTDVNGTTPSVGVNVTFKGRRTDKSKFPIGAAPVATDANGEAPIDFPNPSPASANRVTVWAVAVVVPAGVGPAVEVNSEEVEIGFFDTQEEADLDIQLKLLSRGEERTRDASSDCGTASKEG